jgi:hypothetical protein
MKCGNTFWLRPSFAFSSVLALLALLSVYGKTPLWSQDSGMSSSSSGEHLTTWEALSGRFTLDLEQHEQTLKELGQRLETSEANSSRLMPLYELSLRQNESLKTYNGQIAERMQERDEDLAAAYAENEKQTRIIARLGIALCAALAAIVVLVVLYNRRKLPFLPV